MKLQRSLAAEAEAAREARAKVMMVMIIAMHCNDDRPWEKGQISQLSFGLTASMPCEKTSGKKGGKEGQPQYHF